MTTEWGESDTLKPGIGMESNYSNIKPLDT
jgi:hypothetical protein